MIRWIEKKRGNVEFALWVMFMLGVLFGLGAALLMSELK